MNRWDLLLIAAAVLLVVPAALVDGRLGSAVAGACCVAVWYWLGESEDH